jgi:hypothetical protein
MNKVMLSVRSGVQIKRIIHDIDRDRRIEDKRNMREFVKKICKKRGN